MPRGIGPYRVRSNARKLLSRMPLQTLILFIVAGLIPGMLEAATATLSTEARNCLTCHSDPGAVAAFGDRTTITAYVDAKKFAGSVHGPLGCTDCHADVLPDKHPGVKYPTKEKFIRTVTKSCDKCHADALLMANPLHQRVISRPNAPSCSVCHGVHDIRKAPVLTEKGASTHDCLTCHSKRLTKSIQGEVHSLTIEEGWIRGSVHRKHECIDCHTVYEYTREFHPTPGKSLSSRDRSITAAGMCIRCHYDKAVQQKDSIHAALLSRGNQRAPVCTDCHGAHAVGPGVSAKTREGAPCRKCHAEIFAFYRQSVHGVTISRGSNKRPFCGNCHRSHDIKPAMASRTPREMCLGCHAAATTAHEQWLPNSQAHMTMVACTACHVPVGYVRSIYVRLTDAKSGKLLGDEEVRRVLEARGVSGKRMGPKELWLLYHDLNEKRRVGVSIAVSMNTSRFAHHIEPKVRAIKRCETCHSAGSSFFQTMAVAVSGPDGREVLHEVDPKALQSVYGIVLLRQFNVMSGTRLTALDWIGAAMILAGLAVSLFHGAIMLLTVRRRRNRPDHREEER